MQSNANEIRLQSRALANKQPSKKSKHGLTLILKPKILANFLKTFCILQGMSHPIFLGEKLVKFH